MIKNNNELTDRIVNEVKERLNEISISQKKRNVNDVERFFKNRGGGLKGIKTIVVLTAENPDSQAASRQFNKKANRSLLKDIKDGGYAYVPAEGRFGNVERPYAVFNMSIDAAKYYCGKYQQTSFIITMLSNDNKVHSEYWEKANTDMPYSKHNNDYVKKDECDEWVDMSDATDYFTVIGGKFKYSIPFSIFESTSRLFTDNIKRMIVSESRKNKVVLTENDILDFSINRVGMSAYLRRKAITKGFYRD